MQAWPREFTPAEGTRASARFAGTLIINLKWAFIETANLVAIHQKHLAGRHVVRLYQRIRRKSNYQKAVVAVARHLAEATYWILKKQEIYREPQPKTVARAESEETNFVDVRVSAKPAIAL